MEHPGAIEHRRLSGQEIQLPPRFGFAGWRGARVLATFVPFAAVDRERFALLADPVDRSAAGRPGTVRDLGAGRNGVQPGLARAGRLLSSLLLMLLPPLTM